MANVKEVALSNQLSGHCSGAKLQGSRSHAQQRNAWVDALRRERRAFLYAFQREALRNYMLLVRC